MTNPEKPEANGEIQLGDLFRPLLQYRRLIWQGTLAVTAAAALMGAFYLVFQPRAWTATLGFRPVFEGADDGMYPNGIPFAATDVTDASIVSAAFAKNELQSYCSADAFRSGLGVRESSAALQFLSLEFQARLSDPRLSSIDRQRLQEEFTGRRASMPREYDLVFSRPVACATMPDALVLKMMTDVLEEWAVESQARRGVLKMTVGILTPAVFEPPNAADATILVRADLVRARVMRVILNIAEVERLPGSELVTIGENRVGLVEVRMRLEDLMHARLDPLIGMAGRGLGRESARWVSQALNSATADYQAAEKRAEAYRLALREYSGVAATPASSTGTAAGKPQSSSDVQTLTPQIDRTFIAGIVELSATNTAFRQEITRKLIDSSIAAVNLAQVMEHYRWLLTAIQETGGDSLSADEVSRRLNALIGEAKDATKLFNQIYDEFSNVAFRVGPNLSR